MENSLFNYRGRIPTRADGKARREALLEATLQLIIADGVRAVRHRAVAEKAEVPLAATTYYFADIYDLIHDAFVYFTEKVMQQAREFESESFKLLENLSESETYEHNFLVSKVAEFATQYFYQQSQDKDSRILEQVIRTQALRDKKIAEIISAIEQRQLDSIEHFLERLKLDNRDVRSQVVHGLFLRIKYELSTDSISFDEVREIFQKGLKLALAN
ncbi:TetR/AcrR family transcriptional regulator [Pleionea sediminis]|uniref:TetR/AcrR family transcriptional regulator n=1 Tax=Pleionea sediminis TaxID=2569479 RepID=UPI00118509CF|nr:TetR family transcriptional regulator [Pleionea sediminis]